MAPPYDHRRQEVRKTHPDLEGHSHALDKVSEFVKLQYPINVLKGACTLLAASLQAPTWFDIRDSIKHLYNVMYSSPPERH